jgi:enoyl-CoA hydratase/carnithine racemase
MDRTVRLTVDDGIAEVTLDRPHRLNAINDALLADFAEALRTVNGDDRVGAIILSGAGRAFCAGDDLKEFGAQVGSEAATRAYIESIQEITRLLMLNDKPVIGAIHGWAVGGGFEWVLNCDFAIMAEDTRCFFPEIALGVFVTGGVTRLLPQLVGLQKAKELVLFGERIGAREALALGIAWRVVPQDRLTAEARTVARRLLALPAPARRHAKTVFNRAAHLPLEQAMALETKATVEGFLDPGTARRIAEAIG